MKKKGIGRLLVVLPSALSQESTEAGLFRDSTMKFATQLNAQADHWELKDAQSDSEGSELILERAAETNADLILLPGIAGRSKFAEHVLRKSPIPILHVPVSMDWTRLHSSPRILFPTDLHKEARKVLDMLIPFARQLRASVTIFHEVPRPAGYALEVGPAPQEYQVSWEDDRMERQEIAEFFVRRFHDSGVDADAKLARPGRPVLDTILDLGRGNGYSLIAIGARSGPIEAYFTGLITRRLLSKAPCPVWAIHEHNIQELEQIPGAA